VVAQQLFTTVKRENAIAQNWKTAHRITVSRFFVGGLSLPLARKTERRIRNEKIY
jgi:hypothetical protein